MLRVLIVDGNQVMRLGLKHLLGSQGCFEVVGESSSAKDAVQLVANLKPNILLTDIQLSDGNVIEEFSKMLEVSPSTRIIALTTSTDDEQIFAAIMAGACGYLLKQIETDELVKAISKVEKGGIVIDPEVAGKLIQKLRNLAQGNQSKEELSPQEKRILCLIAEGKTNREIGENLVLSEKTVKNYISAIFSKLNISNRAEAAVFAVKHLA